MPETALEKLLRLAAGPSRKPVLVHQFQRLVNGRVQVVHQHVQQHASGGPRRVNAGALKTGNVIQAGQIQYSVTGISPYQHTAAKKGAPNNSNVRHGVNTGSQGQGVNTAPISKGPPAKSGNQGRVSSVDPQKVLDAAGKAAGIAFDAPEVRLGLRQLTTNAHFTVLVAKTTPVLVVR